MARASRPRPGPDRSTPIWKSGARARSGAAPAGIPPQAVVRHDDDADGFMLLLSTSRCSTFTSRPSPRRSSASASPRPRSGGARRCSRFRSYVGLPLTVVEGQQEAQQARRACSKQRLPKRRSPARTRPPPIASRALAQPLLEVGVRQEAHVEEQLGGLGRTVAEAERDHVHHRGPRLSRDVLDDGGLQLVDVQRRGVDHVIRQRGHVDQQVGARPRCPRPPYPVAGESGCTRRVSR